MSGSTAASKGRPGFLLATWERWDHLKPDRHRPGMVFPGWVADDEPPTRVRASFGAKRVTVWLPLGPRIVLHRGFDNLHRGAPFKGFHYFGSTERGTRTRIVFRAIEGEPQP